MTCHHVVWHVWQVCAFARAAKVGQLYACITFLSDQEWHPGPGLEDWAAQAAQEEFSKTSALDCKKKSKVAHARTPSPCVCPPSPHALRWSITCWTRLQLSLLPR